MGDREDLIRNGMKVGRINPMKYDAFPTGEELYGMIRYNDKGSLCMINHVEGNELEVEFMTNVHGVAPGQSAVFYEGDDVVGGGVILRGN